MKRSVAFLALLAFVLSACDSQAPVPSASEIAVSDAATSAAKKKHKKKKKKLNNEPTVSPFLAELNEQIEAEGLDFRIAHAEWVAAAESGRAGQIVFAKNRGNKQLGAHFVSGDPRRDGRTNITYVVDESDGATNDGLTNAQTEAAIDRAMTTWEEGTQCSRFAIDEVPYRDLVEDLAEFGVEDIGFIEALILGPGNGFPAAVPFADLIHAGWLSADFFDALAPGGSEFILGVTFTLLFVDENGDFTDINNDGKLDVAFREIYYNDNFNWGINAGVSPYDVETVALHEAGHGLSQAHFGKIFLTPSNGKLHFAPFAVMNAAISRQAQNLEGTDNGGHCSIWGSWPNQ